ncbi:MAG: alpha/beta hydrolase [Clostridia bacterium]|nr:alpha/beta hydrolase [Clostridia bacterium]
MAACEKFLFSSTAGPLLEAKWWKPEGKPRAVVQLVHGMAEHIGRYEKLARMLTAADFAVVGHDQLGHGPRAQVKGFFADRDGWQHLIDDVQRLRGIAQEQYPVVPYILLGHSMGSFVTRCCAAEHGEGLAGVILCGTGSLPEGTLKAGAAAAKLISLLGGRKKPSNFLHGAGFGGMNRHFRPVRTDWDWLSRDAAEVDKYVADSNCGFVFTAGGFGDLFRGMRRIAAPESFRGVPKELPLLLISGDRDPVGGMGRDVERIAQAYRDAGMTRVQARLYPEARHELFHELDSARAMRDVVIFIEEILKSA